MFACTRSPSTRLAGVCVCVCAHSWRPCAERHIHTCVCLVFRGFHGVRISFTLTRLLICSKIGRSYVTHNARGQLTHTHTRGHFKHNGSYLIIASRVFPSLGFFVATGVSVYYESFFLLFARWQEENFGRATLY